jgi:hypothetical protein
MKQYTLQRTGKGPLTFEGALVAESDPPPLPPKKPDKRPTRRRWHYLAVYRTKAGAYVVQISYRSEWPLDLGHDLAVIVEGDARRGVVQAFAAYDPTEHVRGFPPGAQFAERQEALLRDIEAQYRKQVSEILSADPAFIERIE